MESKRPDTIPGYVHPETTTKHRGTVYKTFTEGQKPKKKEQFGNTIGGTRYASYDLENQTHKKTQQEIEKDRQTFEQMYSQQEK